MLKWDFTKLSTVKYETNTYEIVENYENITVVSGTAHIVLAPSSDGTCRVVCHEKKNVKHTVAVVDGVLSVQAVDTRKWYEHIGIDFGRPSITVYLPMAEYGALAVKTKTGDLEIPDTLTFGRVDASGSTGDVTFASSDGAKILVETDTGDVTGTLLSDNVYITKTSTGRIDVPQTVEGGRCEITTDTGNIKITVQKD